MGVNVNDSAESEESRTAWSKPKLQELDMINTSGMNMMGSDMMGMINMNGS